MESTISCPRVYESNSHYCSCSWNYHINIVGRHINLFSGCMCLFFSFNCPTPNIRTIRWYTTTQRIPLAKLDATAKMLRPEVFGLCLSIEAYPITKNIWKKHFMSETFISIGHNLQRRIRLHHTDRLSHDKAFWNLHFLCQILSLKTSSIFFMWYQCLYYAYSLPQDKWHSPIYSQNWNKYINSY